jgi:hypothetical protein
MQTIILKQFLIIPFIWGALNNGQTEKSKFHCLQTTSEPKKTLALNLNKSKNMGISINLYRVGKAEKFEDLKDLESQIVKTEDTKVDLYRITEDLAIIFLNTNDPYKDTNTIPYKMLYGRHCEKNISIGDIGGFLPSSEIPEITKWIKANKIETFDGFSKMYDSLSIDVKEQLEDMGTDDKVSLFNGYVRPLTVLYFTALENQNSVIFVGQ